MANSCSHWWHAPIYFVISAMLAFIAISTGLHPNPSNVIETPSNNSITHNLSLNASKALRKSGFNVAATLLQVSPEIFFSSSESTIFAIRDSAISNISLRPWHMKELLQYHTSPSKLSMEDLLKKPQKSCFPTLLHGKNLAITKTDAKQRKVEINHVLISHPDVFLEGPISIHGVLGSFSSLDPQESWDFIQSSICDSNSSTLVFDISDRSKNTVEWNRIVRLLSSNGFVSFAIGLHSVLDEILQDYPHLNSITIFAPPDLAFVASPSPLLDEIVRFHILPQRFTYIELAALPEKAFLRTLIPDRDLQITKRVNSTQRLAINGVEIAAPDIFTSKKFIVHGISRVLVMADLPNTS